MHLSVSMTTRSPRPGEREGMDYYFSQPDAFKSHMENQAFAEHARVFDHHYGSLRGHIDQRLDKGHDVVFDIDWQGARQLRQSYGSRVWSLFILPPNLKTLAHRLHSRGEDDPKVIESRMAKALEEMSHAWEYDHVVVNHQFEPTLHHIQNLIHERKSTD